MVGDMLTRKLLRDIRQTAGQFAAVAAVVFCGVSVFVSQRAAYVSLLLSRDTYYEQYRFADFFVHLEKAPESALRDVESIPGVLQGRGRIVKDVPLDVPGNDGAVVGRIISMPPRRDGLINDIYIVTGSYFPGAAATEVIVNHPFCAANGLRVGDTFQATMNERKETLRIVGTAYSPEYVYAIRTPQQFAPDDRNFAVIFARRKFVEDAFNMTNAFNDLSGLLRPGANVNAVLDQAKERLKAYGVYHKYGRDLQISNHYLSQEMEGLRTSSMVTPLIFLGVAALVIHVLLRRMTELQRTQIGVLCALGFSRLRIIRHYVAYAVGVGLAGGLPGIAAGYLLAAWMTRFYNEFFRFPRLYVRVSPGVAVGALALSGGLCALGALRSARRILRLEPAVAVRPQAPAGGRPVHAGAFEGLWVRLPLTWRISLRNSLRTRNRAIFTVAGVALATAILVLGLAMMDWFDFIIAYQFGLVDRSDLRVDFAAEQPDAAALELASVPGVDRAEGIIQFGAELRNGWHKKTVLVVGLPADSRLYRLHDAAGRYVAPPPEGLVLPERAARELGLSVGSTVYMDPYLKGKDERPISVRALTDEYVGLSVYATKDFLARWLGEGPFLNGALIAAATPAHAVLADRLDDMPGVQSVTATGDVLGGFQDTVRDMMNVATIVLTVFAGTIAFAVIYNSSSVTIAEQERDLACMHSLGYDRESVAQVATNDIMPLGILGTLAGLPLGVLACHGLARLYETDLYKLPVVIAPGTMVGIVALVLTFQLVARWACRRRVYRIDVVRRLKTME
jgi:putative ABC transport system permease protein